MSAPRLRLLWVTQEAPDAALGGGNIRQAALIRALSRWIDVHLVMIGPLSDREVRDALAGLTEVADPGMPRPRTHLGARLLSLWLVLVRREPREIFLNRRTCRALRAVLAAEADRHDVVLVNHQALIPLLPETRRASWLIHLHNVSATRTRQRLDTASGRRRRWLFAREAAMEARAEHFAVRSYDGVVVISAHDAELVGATDNGPVLIVPNGVDTERFAMTPLPVAHRVVLSASLNYPPNAEGAVWFTQAVLPLIRNRVSDVSFAVVGRDPGREVRELARIVGVEVHADVPDVLPWLQRARVSVVPLRQGTGTRLKALEALAAGRPLVGTTIGLEGLDLIDGEHALIADESQALADAVVKALTDDGLAQRLVAAGRALVEGRYRWEAVAEQFANELNGLGG